MRAGLGFLRWPPDTFWRATPRELAAALRPIMGGHAPMRGTELAGLMAQFPDGRQP